MQLFKVLPLAGILLVAAIVFVWRPWLQRRRHGTWGVLLLAFGLLVGQALAAALRPELLPLAQADLRATPALRHIVGAMLLFGGVLLLVIAQLDLGASWRIGIEEDAKPGLVTGGLYRYCRNPIFLGLLVTLAGYTLLVPTFLSAVILAGAYVAIRRQIVEEERYLARAYGEPYRAYARRVGRLVPGIGKSA